MDNEYNPDIITVIDESGTEHIFEELDRIENEKGKYVALIPVYDENSQIIDDDGELIILKVKDDNGEVYLAPIENSSEFKEVGSIFQERLEDIFEITEEQ